MLHNINLVKQRSMMEEVNLDTASQGVTICCSVPSSDGHPATSLLEGGALLAVSCMKP